MLSSPENQLRVALNAAGIIHAPQFHIQGQVYDFALPMDRIIIEVDGSAHRRHFAKRRDKKKALLAQRFGWRVERLKTPLKAAAVKRLMRKCLQNGH